jgi:uncharacterized protein (DUF2062 family)
MSGRLRRSLQILFHLEDTPRRVALAFGVGVWIAFFPVLGVHTLMALGIAFAFRLSRAAILLGAYVNNPWTIAPLYLAGTLLGCALLGVSTEGLGHIRWDLHGAEFYRELAVGLRPYVWPFVVGNTILGIVAGAVAYVIVRHVLERRSQLPSEPSASMR